MVQVTINAVKQAEETADKKLKDAAEEGKRIVDEARKQADKIKEDTLKGVKDKASAVNGTLLQKGYTYLSQSVEEADGEIASLKENAEKKTDEVVETIISKLV